MAYLVDVDSYNYIDASFRSFGKRLYLDSNGTLYCVFRNLNDELEIRKSYDGGQSWYSVASRSLSDVDAEKKDLLYIGKRNDKICVVFDFWNVDIGDGNYDVYVKCFYEDGTEESLNLGSMYHAEPAYGHCILDNGKIGLCIYYGLRYNGSWRLYTCIKFEDGNTPDIGVSETDYNSTLHSYDEDLCLYSAEDHTDGSNLVHLAFYQKEIDQQQAIDFGSRYDRIQSWFKIVKISNNLSYFIAHEKDQDDDKYKVNLYKFEFDSATLTKVATVVDTTNVGEQPILGGHYDIAKDGYGNVYIMYVKYPPNDYLFLRKFDTFTETLEDEQQLTDFKVRTPQMVSSLPNSKYIYYTYTRKS